MKSKKLRILSVVFLVILQLFSVSSAGANDLTENDNGVTLVDSTNVYEETDFYKESLFGIAGGFHLVGLNSVANPAHVHGNILTDSLKYGGNFGTDNGGGVKEVSYIKKIEANGVFKNSSHKDSIVVVGKDHIIDTADNGNAWSIDGNTVDSPKKRDSPNSLWQDNQAEFIDLNKVKQEVESLVSKLAGLSDNATVIKNEDQNNQEIIVSETDEFNVYHIKNGDFNLKNPIHIKGFDKSKVSTLIINVDMSKMDNKELLSIPNSVAHYTDASTVSTGEVIEWSNANVVWNVYDSSNANNIYTGKIENEGAVTGSILSPGATVNLESNLNGTVIANDIVVKAESHRDDYVGYRLPDPDVTSISVKKEWVGNPQEKVTINLLADGTAVDSVELSDENSWKHVFTNLLEMNEDTSEAIAYTIEEEAINGYKTVITGSAEEGFIVTNIENETPIDPGKTEVAVKKVWEGNPKDSVTINLLADGKQLAVIQLSDENDWRHVFVDLPVVNNITDEKAIVYTVVEKTIEGYETNITGNAQEGFTVTNTEILDPTQPEPSKTEVAVEKVWEGKAQEKVTINLLSDGKQVDSIELSASSNWKHVFTGLPTENSGKVIVYTVEEVAVEGYETNITGNVQEGFTVTNTEIIDESVISPESEESDILGVGGDKLPNTATETFNYLLIGLSLVLLGGLAYFLYRKKSIEE